jgi:hypothetical protein
MDIHLHIGPLRSSVTTNNNCPAVGRDINSHLRTILRTGCVGGLVKYFGRIALMRRAVRVAGTCLCTDAWLVEVAGDVGWLKLAAFFVGIFLDGIFFDNLLDNRGAQGLTGRCHVECEFGQNCGPPNLPLEIDIGGYQSCFVYCMLQRLLIIGMNRVRVFRRVLKIYLIKALNDIQAFQESRKGNTKEAIPRVVESF